MINHPDGADTWRVGVTRDARVAATARAAAPIDGAGRIVAIDALRGFAVLGIFIINIQMMAMIEAAATNPTLHLEFHGVNRWIWMLSHVLADQKFMTIFSLLFGAGVLLMTSRIEARGLSSTLFHYRRMVILLLIGLVHAYLIWYGDILVIYALCGMVVFLFRRHRARTLIFVGMIAVAIPSLLSLCFGWSMRFWPDELANELRGIWSPSPATIADDAAAYRGSYVDAFRHRAPTALEVHTTVLLIWGLWRAGGLMLIGMGLQKLGVFGAERSRRFYAALAMVGLCIGVPVIVYGLHRNIATGWSPEYSFFLGTQFNYWASILVSGAWIGVIMLLCKAGPFVVTPLAAVGRMALTNYLAQSVVGTTIFYGHGFGWYGKIDLAGQMLIVSLVWTLQLIASTVWLRRFRFGPVEWLWRTLTYRWYDAKRDMNIVIERASESDRPRIFELLEQANMHEVPSPEMPALSYETYFVARLDGRVVGFCGYKVLSPTEAKTELMVVDDACRGLGVGLLLQTRRMDDMLRQGIESVTTNADLPATIAWYKKHFGYKEVGTLKKIHEFGDPAIAHWTTLRCDLLAWDAERRKGRS